MEAKTFSGKAIRHPNGKAGEYARFATDAYFGCSNGCGYCYLQKGVWKRLWSPYPKLLQKFSSLEDAKSAFRKDLAAILLDADLSASIRRHGLLMNFESDPFLRETRAYTDFVLESCLKSSVPVALLTKRAEWAGEYLSKESGMYASLAALAAFGFTLTGHDELEPNASTNAERIEAMKKLHDAGFKTWASIEPIVDFSSSRQMMDSAAAYCGLYKVGLESGKKYSKKEARDFIGWAVNSSAASWLDGKIYFKDSLLKAADIDRSELPDCCVAMDYSIFNG
jgi:DNA repair photolyase